MRWDFTFLTCWCKLVVKETLCFPIHFFAGPKPLFPTKFTPTVLSKFILNTKYIYSILNNIFIMCRNFLKGKIIHRSRIAITQIAWYVNWNLFPYCCFFQTLASKCAPKQIYFVKKIKSGDLNPRSLNLLQFHCLFTVIFPFGYCLRQLPCSTITKFRLRFNQYKSNIKLYGEGRRNFK